MGTRGSGPRRASNINVSNNSSAKNALTSNIMDATNFNELKTVMGHNYNIILDAEVNKIDYSILQNTCKSIIEVSDEFGFEPSDLVSDIYTNNKSDIYAEAYLYEKIELSLDNMADGINAKKLYEHDVESGYHPKGTTINNIADHELGHRLEALMIDKINSSYKNRYRYDRNSAMWKNNVLSEKMVNNAVMTIYGGLNDAVIKKGQKSISRYAMKNYAETWAEAFADYRANGTNAKPMSIQLVKEFKKLMKLGEMY